MPITYAMTAAILWTAILLFLSHRMLRAQPKQRARYAEVIGCLILLAIFMVFILPVMGAVR